MVVVKVNKILKEVDQKTKKYLEKLIKDITMIGAVSSQKSYRKNLDYHNITYKRAGILHNLDKLPGGNNRATIYMFSREGEERFLAEFYVNNRDYENFKILGFFFTGRPKKEEVYLAYFITKIFQKIKRNEPTVSCKECNAKVHWTELKGLTLNNKLNMWDREYITCEYHN